MQNTQNAQLFEQMPIPRATGKLVIPTILSSLVMVLYNIADTFFVGLLNDPIQNAAVTLAAPAMLAFNAVNNLFGVGASSMMSRALGRKDYDTVRQSAAFGFYCALGCGLVLSLFCTIFFSPLLHLLGTEANTLDATADYMRWTVLCGAAPSILNVVMAYLVRAEGAALHASVGTMSGCLLNILLDPLFILPWGLNMGAAGAGLATLLSNCFACCYYFVLLRVRRGRTFICLQPHNFRLNREIVRGVCGVGIPASIQNLLNVAGMTLFNNATAAYGPDAVAAMGIAQKIYMIPVQIALGGTQGVMPLVSYSYAARNYDRMRASIRFVAQIMLPFMFIVAAFCWLNAEGLIGLFMKNESIIAYGTLFLRALSLAIPFIVLDFLAVGVFQAFGMGRKSLIFALLRKAAFEIPAMLLLNQVFGLQGLPYAAFIAEFLLACIGSGTLMHTIKKMV